MPFLGPLDYAIRLYRRRVFPIGGFTDVYNMTSYIDDVIYKRLTYSNLTAEKPIGIATQAGEKHKPETKKENACLLKDKNTATPQLAAHVVVGSAPYILVADRLDGHVHAKLLLHFADNTLL